MKKHLKVPIQERDAWLSKWHSGKKKIPCLPLQEMQEMQV